MRWIKIRVGKEQRTPFWYLQTTSFETITTTQNRSCSAIRFREPFQSQVCSINAPLRLIQNTSEASHNTSRTKILPRGNSKAKFNRHLKSTLLNNKVYWLCSTYIRLVQAEERKFVTHFYSQPGTGFRE